MTPEDLAALHARAERRTQAWSRASFAGLLGTAGVFVCASPIRFALGRVTHDEAELLMMAVDPEHMRKGHGRAVLAAFEHEAISRGGAQGFLEVAAPNTEALGLYNSAGWAQTGLRQGYYTLQDGTKADAIVMSKTWTP